LTKRNSGAKEGGSAVVEVTCFQSTGKVQVLPDKTSLAELAHLGQEWWFSATVAEEPLVEKQ